MQPSSFFGGAGGGGGFCWSGSGSKFNCAAGSGRVGSGQTISGTGRVRASVLSPCRTLIYIYISAVKVNVQLTQRIFYV